MVVRIAVDQRRFSWLIFAVCMLEVVLWAAPPVSAIASSRPSFTTEEMYRNHILKEKDHYVHASGLNGQIIETSPRDEALDRMLEHESYVRVLLFPLSPLMSVDCEFVTSGSWNR